MKVFTATEIVGCVQIAWCIALTFTIIFTIKGVSCIDELKMGYGMTATNVVTGFIVLFLPVPELRKVQTSTARKRAMFGMFLLGSL